MLPGMVWPNVGALSGKPEGVLDVLGATENFSEVNSKFDVISGIPLQKFHVCADRSLVIPERQASIMAGTAARISQKFFLARQTKEGTLAVQDALHRTLFPQTVPSASRYTAGKFPISFCGG